MNRILSAGIDNVWRNKAINQLKKRNHKSIIDLASGTGDFAIKAAKKLKNIQKIEGIDISENMLEIGKQKIKRKKLDHIIRLQVADAEEIPFENNTFDAATIGFGIRNFNKRNESLNDIYRVLDKNGTLVILELGDPNSYIFKKIYKIYFNNILPFLGRLLSKDKKAYTYLPNSVYAFPKPSDFVKEIENAGFSNVRNISLIGGVANIFVGEKNN